MTTVSAPAPSSKARRLVNSPANRAAHELLTAVRGLIPLIDQFTAAADAHFADAAADAAGFRWAADLFEDLLEGDVLARPADVREPDGPAPGAELPAVMLSPAERLILDAIDGPTKAKVIQKRTGIQRATLGILLNNMVARGVLVRSTTVHGKRIGYALAELA